MDKQQKQVRIPVISGSGRSGTTWVLDVLAQSNDMRTAFEPLHPIAVPLMDEYANMYLTEYDDSPRLSEFLIKVFSGKFKNIWVSYRVRPDRLMPFPQNFLGYRRLHEYLARWRKLYRQMAVYKKDIGKPVITKFIRANMMYAWLLKNFNIRIVHVIRHPCAVIESKLRLGGDDWDVDKELKAYLDQSRIADWVKNFIEPEAVESLTETGRYALIWCIENILPFSDDTVTVAGEHLLKVHFESLAAQDMNVWMAVSQHLGLQEVPDQSLLVKPSQQARPENKDKNYNKQMTSGWRKRLSAGMISEIESVLNSFKVTEYSINSAEPILTGR